MAAEPAAPSPDTRPYEVIHLGGQAAVVVPVADFLRLRALERAASPRSSRTPRTPRRCSSGRRGTLPARPHTCRTTRHAVGWPCPGEPADRIQRAGGQPGGRIIPWGQVRRCSILALTEQAWCRANDRFRDARHKGNLLPLRSGLVTRSLTPRLGRTHHEGR
jgi:hypothetical protein